MLRAEKPVPKREPRGSRRSPRRVAKFRRSGHTKSRLVIPGVRRETVFQAASSKLIIYKK